VSDDGLRGADAMVTARVLSAAITKSEFDVVIAGVESTDGYTGTLPMTIAGLLGVPSVTFARKLEVADGRVRIERQTELGYDVVEADLPVVVTVTAGATDPRYPTLKGIMQAKQKSVERYAVGDLGLSADDVAPTQKVDAVDAAPEKGPGEIVEDDGSGAEKITAFLQEAKVI
jgi:electron transfer flavoprotein beta subunit